MIDLANTGVESSYASKAGGKGNLTHRQTGLVNELFGKVQTPCLSDGNRRCSQVSQEQAAEMPRSNSQAFGENFYATVFHATLTDQAQGS